MLGYVLSLVLFGHGQNLWLIFGVSMLGTLVFVFFIQRIQFKNVIFVPLIGIIFGNVIDSLATFIAYKYDAIQNLSGWAVANFANLLKGDFELLYIAIPVAIFSYLYAARISAVGMGKRFCDQSGFELSTGHDHRCGLSLHHVGDRGHDCRSTAFLGFDCA